MKEYILGLFDELNAIDDLNNKITFSDKILTINFHKDYKLEVLVKSGYGIQIYINSIFGLTIEEQDIVEFIKELEENKYFTVIKKKKPLLSKSAVSFISQQKFEKNISKWKSAKDVKVLSADKTIINNY